MKAKNKVIVGLLLVGLAAAIFQFNREPKRRTTTPPQEERTKVRLATSLNAWCGLPLIALDKGFFEEEGLEIDLVVQPVGKLCVDALRSSSVEIATAVEVNFAYLGFAAPMDIRLVTTIVRSDSSALVARRSAGISKPQDLTGKSVALIPGTTTQLFAHRVLERNKIADKDVTIRSFQPNSIVGALVAGEVDCASLWEPLIQTAVSQMGHDAIIFRDPEAYTGFMAVAVRRDWGLQNKATIQKFVRALNTALSFVQSNESEAQAIIAKRLKVEQEVIVQTWKYYDYRVDPSRHEIQPVLEEEGRWIRATQDDYRDKVIPDYSVFFESELMIPSTSGNP